MKVESEVGDIGFIVEELDIQYIVLVWIGIFVEKVFSDEFDCLLKMEDIFY